MSRECDVRLKITRLIWKYTRSNSRAIAVASKRPMSVSGHIRRGGFANRRNCRSTPFQQFLARKRRDLQSIYIVKLSLTSITLIVTFSDEQRCRRSYRNNSHVRLLPPSSPPRISSNLFV